MPVTFDHVSFRYPSEGGQGEGRYALKDVSFTVADGEFLGIIGHTGSGKSTLIQMVNGLLLPLSGQVTVDGIDTAAGRRERKDIRAKVGIVFQYPEYQLFGNTVEEDVSFGPRNSGIAATEVALRVNTALKRVGLDPDRCLKRSPFEFSGGQKRRIALAGVLAMAPDVLVLDEPMAGLDPQGCREIMGFIRTLHHEGMTIIMVSHSMEDVAENATRVLVLKEGEVFATGVPEEVFKRAAELREIGLGVPIETSFAHELAESCGFRFDRTTFTLEQLADAIAPQVGGRATEVFEVEDAAEQEGTGERRG